MTEFGWIIPIVKMYSGILQILMLYSFTPTHNPFGFPFTPLLHTLLTLGCPVLPSRQTSAPVTQSAGPALHLPVPRDVRCPSRYPMSVLSLTMSVMSDVCAMSDVHTMSWWPMSARCPCCPMSVRCPARCPCCPRRGRPRLSPAPGNGPSGSRGGAESRTPPAHRA